MNEKRKWEVVEMKQIMINIICSIFLAKGTQKIK